MAWLSSCISSVQDAFPGQRQSPCCHWTCLPPVKYWNSCWKKKLAVWISYHSEQCESVIIPNSVNQLSFRTLWIIYHSEQCELVIIPNSVNHLSLQIVWISYHSEHNATVPIAYELQRYVFNFMNVFVSWSVTVS